MKKGFTLVELLTVVAIIGILATIITLNLTEAQKKSRDAKRKSDLTQIASALETYKADNKIYIETATFTDIATSLASLLPNYIASIPVDPRPDTDSAYLYQSDKNQFKVIATAPEGLSGVTDDTEARRVAGEFYDPAVGNNLSQFQISSSAVAAGWVYAPPEEE